MKISLSMYSLHRYNANGKMNIVDFIKYAHNLGIEGVELLDVFWKDIDNEFPEALNALKQTGLAVSCYSVGNNFVHPQPERRVSQGEIVKNGVDMAEKLGAKVVRVFSGDMGNYDVTFDEAKGWIIEGLKECAAYAQTKGIILGLENHGLFAGKSSQVKSIISEVGSRNLRATFDTGNFLLVDESPSDAIDSLLPLIAHVHFKDFRETDIQEDMILKSINDKKFVGTISGQGQVDLGYILKALDGAGYNGWLSVEFEGQEDEKEGSRTSIENLRNTLKSV